MSSGSVVVQRGGGSLTREQFLMREMRIVADLRLCGMGNGGSAQNGSFPESTSLFTTCVILSTVRSFCFTNAAIASCRGRKSDSAQRADFASKKACAVS